MLIYTFPVPKVLSFTTHVACWVCFGSVMVRFCFVDFFMEVVTGGKVVVKGSLSSLMIGPKEIIITYN